MHTLLKPPVVEDAVPPRVWAAASPIPSQGLPPTGLVSEGVGGGQRGRHRATLASRTEWRSPERPVVGMSFPRSPGWGGVHDSLALF